MTANSLHRSVPSSRHYEMNDWAKRNFVYNAVQSRILDGSIPLGSRVFEPALAKELGVSRTPVREALVRLVHEGIAEKIPNEGIYVKKPSRVDLLEIFEMRILMESYAVELAVDRALPQHLNQMEQSCLILRQMIVDLRTPGERPPLLQRRHLALHKAEMGFHLAIVAAARHACLASVVSNIQVLSRVLSATPCTEETFGMAELSVTYLGHRRILRHIKRKDARRAVVEMRKHLQLGLDSVLKDFDLNERQNSADAAMESLREVEYLLRDINSGE